jgi:MFS family permease
VQKPFQLPLLLIILAQFFCTSLWFAGNAVINSLILDFGLAATALGHLSSAVQFGFISGTLVYALLAFADRFSPSRVFMVSALLGAAANAAVLFIPQNGIWGLLLLRFTTGFFLAGIYPVGMKIAADYFDKGLGRSLGWLVGALVLGTAFPHLLKAWGNDIQWSSVFITTSIMATLGGLLIGLGLADGPYRKAGQKLNFQRMREIFDARKFRQAAFGYFGHMWELYTFWAFLPLLLTAFLGDKTLNVSIWSFVLIASGGLACVLGGILSEKFGPKKVALGALSISGICCLLVPVFAYFNEGIPTVLTLAYLFIWSLAVIADSPLFSTLVAQQAKAEIKATALTMVNCIGFAITIVSIQLLGYLQPLLGNWIFVVLALGPLFGLIYNRH